MGKHKMMTEPRKTEPARRTVLLGAAGAAAVLAMPRSGLAAASVPAPKASLWPEAAFKATVPDAALKALWGSSSLVSTDQVKMEAPDIAENGAVVPISVDANETAITGAALLARHNPYSLACAYEIPEGTSPAISSRLKLARTTEVIAAVKAGGKLYATSKQVKVTLGGCG
ncbi:MAG TPA: thiosulfate oxidation carrier protein SoxY [Acidiphilium sp.]|nr:thiosulfate oxidation carrier protein SoxY [Acidiphilium sp.]